MHFLITILIVALLGTIAMWLVFRGKTKRALIAYWVIVALIAATFLQFFVIYEEPTKESERIEEDDPRWDCATMGNRICGGLDTPQATPRTTSDGCTITEEYLKVTANGTTRFKAGTCPTADGSHWPFASAECIRGDCRDEKVTTSDLPNTSTTLA